MEKIISVENVTKIYKLYSNPKDRLKEVLNSKKRYSSDFIALNGISFDIEKGEIVGIVGRNGSGKSTILKILTRVLTQTSGDVAINGKVSALLELGAGFNYEYTGIENIYLNATMMHISKDKIEEKIPEIIEFADIGEHINQPVKTYSSGMFVRLAFAVAINVDPDILIVDEALAVGDTRFQLKCMDKFLDFKAKGKTIIYVSHDINSIKRFCTRTLWLNDGKLIMDGNTDNVTDRYLDFLKSDLSIDEYLKRSSLEKSNEIEEYRNKIRKSLERAKLVDIAEIKDLKFFDSSWRKITSIQHGEKIFVKVSYIVGDESFDDPTIGVAIHRIDNEYICGLNTKLDKFKAPWQLGYNELILEYDAFNLVGGEYYFDVGIFDKTGIVNIDYKSKIANFIVNMPYIAEGIVVLKHKWDNASF